MSTTDQQTISDIEQGLAEAQAKVRRAEAHLERKRAELVEADAALRDATAAWDAFQPEYDAIMAVSHQPNELINVSDSAWRMSYPKGAAAFGQMQSLKQAVAVATAKVNRMRASWTTDNRHGDIHEAEIYLGQCRAEVGRWEQLAAQLAATQAAEKERRAQGWRPSLSDLASRLRPR